MSAHRVDRIIVGEVLVAASPGGVETAEAVAIADGRVVAIGTRTELLEMAAGRESVVDATGQAVVPGIHDFHLHLVGMARARRAVLLDDVERFDELLARVRGAAAGIPADGSTWLTGRGWHEPVLDATALARLEEAVAGRPVALTSHDGHSMWASALARRAAGIDEVAPDPPGGRLERDERGVPNGILREAAMAAVVAVKQRLHGPALVGPMRETLAELAALGVTGATDAGDADAHGGVGAHAALGDSFSTLAELRGEIADRVRLTVNLPVAALEPALAGGLRTGAPLDGGPLRIGWVKVYSDGALGSRTAALFAPHTCGDTPDAGILRHEPAELSAIVERARAGGLRLAIHAIGDRAVATALDALADGAHEDAPMDRIEHVQLIRPADRPRFAASSIVASLQPIHAAADRDAVEACWSDRRDDAYAWRSLADVGASLAFGSDAPIETHNPWHGLHAAVRRHAPGDGRDPWQPAEAIGAAEALAAYTRGPARALRRADEGHLRPGAVADLAILDLGLDRLLAADESAACARSQLTLLAGREVPLA